MSVESFDEHIGGALNLINVSLRSTQFQRPAFFFSSSIAARSGSSEPICKEDFPETPATALATGYGRGKWVVEKLCERAAQRTPINIGVLRIGQLVGDTNKYVTSGFFHIRHIDWAGSGVWNETEAWPLMFKSAKTTGALPQLDQVCCFIPRISKANTYGS